MPTEPAALSDIETRCDAIEECYEFTLGYAGRGLPSDQGSQVRYQLQRAADAILGLSKSFADFVNTLNLHPAARYEAFLSVLDRDARDSLAAIELVLAQPSISSQIVDNLNASVHLRTLLTDIFLIDGILTERAKANPAGRE